MGLSWAEGDQAKVVDRGRVWLYTCSSFGPLAGIGYFFPGFCPGFCPGLCSRLSVSIFGGFGLGVGFGFGFSSLSDRWLVRLAVSISFSKE